MPYIVINRKSGTFYGDVLIDGIGRLVSYGETKHYVLPGMHSVSLNPQRGGIGYSFNLNLGNNDVATIYFFCDTLGNICSRPTSETITLSDDKMAQFTKEENEEYERRNKLQKKEKFKGCLFKVLKILALEIAVAILIYACTQL